MPKLCDTLAEINFKQTIKLLRKQHLLVPFVRDLAARWSEGSQFGPQAEPDPGNLAFEVSLPTEPPRDCPEDKPGESTTREERLDGPDVLQVNGGSHSNSSSSSQHSGQGPSKSLSPSLSSSRSWSPSPSSSPRPRASLSTQVGLLDRRRTRSPRLEPRESKRPRVSFGNPQLAARSQVPGAKPRASAEEPWRLQVAKPISSKSDAGGKTPAHRIQEGPLAASLEACLNSESSAPSSALPGGRVPLTRCKRRGESTWKAEVLSPGTKGPMDLSESFHHWNDDGVSGRGVPFQKNHPASKLHLPWVTRNTRHRTMTMKLSLGRAAVYSGRAPAASKQGHLPEPDCPWQTHCPDPAVAAAEPVEEPEPWRQEEESRSHTHTDKPTCTQTESITILQLQESQELRLQALRARIQGTLAKKPPGRQTEMIVFPTRVTSPGQQPESGHRGAASSSSETHSLQEASAHG
ncbi:hypothetical protein STEG23_028343 [Scotinomys teguina]